MELTRQCAVCLEHRSPSDFYKGNRSTCKTCKKKRATERRHADPARHAEASREYRRKRRLQREIRAVVLRELWRADAERAAELVRQEADARGISWEYLSG